VTQDLFLLVFYVLLALGVSFMCSVFEAVLLSITPAYVAARIKDGAKEGLRIQALKDDLDRPLAAILSLNTIAHTVGAAGAGAQATKVFSDAYVGVTSGVLTVLILVLSEIIPKSLGAAYWKRLAPVVAWLLIPTTWLMTVTLFVPAARWITRMIGGTGHPTVPSREEISAIAERGAHEGVFPAGESRVLKNLFRLSSLRAADIMTPRTVLFGLSEDEKVGDLVQRLEKVRFSRIPVHRGSLDQISGYVLKSEILLRAARDELDVPIGELRRELKAVPEALRLSTLFDHLLEEQAHVALVVDEYGGTAGLVTMEDLVETLLGMEIVDEADAVTDMQELARRQWEKRASRMGLIALSDSEVEGVDGPPAAAEPAAAADEPEASAPADEPEASAPADEQEEPARSEG